MDVGERAANNGPNITVSLLGVFRIGQATTPVAVPASVAHLVALLGLEESIERATLTNRLWPDLSPDRAQANIRTTLWRLRRVLPKAIITSGELVELSPDVELDTRIIEHWALHVIKGTDLRDDPIANVELPTSAGKELLPGWDDGWLVEHRERLHVIQIQAFEKYANHLFRSGRYAEAMWYAFRVMQMDPLRESAAQLITEIHIKQGNFAEAIRSFERFRSVLKKELGIEPGDALCSAVASAYPNTRIPRQR